MKVLIKDTKEIKDVSKGHALNYLIPQGLAFLATDKVVNAFEKEIEEGKKTIAKKHADSDKLAKDIDGKKIEIVEKASKKGELFGSVGKVKIKKALGVKRNVEIVLPKPIKETGTHTIDVKIGTKKIKVIVNIKAS